MKDGSICTAKFSSVWYQTVRYSVAPHIHASFFRAMFSNCMHSFYFNKYFRFYEYFLLPFILFSHMHIISPTYVESSTLITSSALDLADPSAIFMEHADVTVLHTLDIASGGCSLRLVYGVFDRFNVLERIKSTNTIERLNCLILKCSPKYDIISFL